MREVRWGVVVSEGRKERRGREEEKEKRRKLQRDKRIHSVGKVRQMAIPRHINFKIIFGTTAPTNWENISFIIERNCLLPPHTYIPTASFFIIIK